MSANNEEGWTEVVSKKKRYRKFPPYRGPKLRAVNHFWNGFDEKGNERWYIELSNGAILTSRDQDYYFWVKRYYPGR